MQTPQRWRSRVTATCWEVTPPCQRLWDRDMDMESRDLVLQLTNCQGNSDSELQGFHSSQADSLQTRGMMISQCQGRSCSGNTTPESSSGYYGQDHNQNKAFLPQTGVSSTSTLGYKHQIYLKAKPNLTIQFLGFPLLDRSVRGKSSPGFLKGRC